jgi:hypothetical protein
MGCEGKQTFYEHYVKHRKIFVLIGVQGGAKELVCPNAENSAIPLLPETDWDCVFAGGFRHCGWFNDGGYTVARCRIPYFSIFDKYCYVDIVIDHLW